MLFVTANIFQPLIDVFETVLKFFHNSVGVPWGWSIVLLTVAVRACLIPLTVKQFGSMQRMQQLQPEMKAIQAKYKEDKQRQQQEMMKFYKENKVNPLGSCLPLVAQLPVFISLFYMLRQSLRVDICPAIERAHNHGILSSLAHGPVRPPRGSRLPVRQRPHRQGNRCDADRPDPALHRDPARLEPDDVERHDGSHAAQDHAVHAAVLRAVRDQFPRWRDRLLDHHQLLDDPAAVRGQAANRADTSPPAAATAVGTTSVVPTARGSSRRDANADRKPAAQPSGNGSGGGGLGGLLRGRKAGEEPAVAAGPRSGPPPRPPRKKKKRSGRRR